MEGSWGERCKPANTPNLWSGGDALGYDYTTGSLTTATTLFDTDQNLYIFFNGALKLNPNTIVVIRN